ncbi:MAG: DUF2157 domain-containing protein, partial [Sphingobacteriales bacterium]
MFQHQELRERVRIIARHSNMSRRTATQLYHDYGLNAGRSDWRKFAEIALLCIGTGFTLAGIIFFFAYNWDALPKAFKIGSIETLLVVATVFAAIGKANELIQKMALFVASILAGALFAVYGQIYQTGADAYDFFMGWAGAVALWCVFSRFPPLWLLLMLLVNLTLWFYFRQVDPGYHETTRLILLFLLNVLPLTLFEILNSKNKLPANSGWMLKTIALVSAAFLTTGLVYSIFDTGGMLWFLTWLAMIVYFPLAIY